jgi:hypothetical protein
VVRDLRGSGPRRSGRSRRASPRGSPRAAAKNLRDNAQFGHLPEPEGARKLWYWEDDGAGNWSRRFDGTRRGVGLDQTGVFANRVDVDLDGVQHSDGSIVRAITVYSKDSEITAEQARSVAAALTEAADELDRLGNRSA